MEKIKLLDENIINKIAAGEVVERPSSVVKELVENAIDAGATIITIEIVDGGTSLIRVSDNGSGIAEADIATVFLRHATSKLRRVEDLENILTLGFRGEAMSSISAVSKLELVTKRAEDTVGTLIEMDGGKVVTQKSIGAAQGTSIIVRNLFYNVPARLKFLKKPTAEANHITDMIEKFVLSNPAISFKYILHGKKVLDTGGKDLKMAIYNIYGKEYYRELLPVDHQGQRLHVQGYVAKPVANRPNRNFCNFFLNGRYIKNQLLQTAVEEAYKTKLPIGKFPVFVLYVNISPEQVDVNVHPTKLEVRFQREQEIYDEVYQVVQGVLNEGVIIPSYYAGGDVAEAEPEEPEYHLEVEIADTPIREAADQAQTQPRALRVPEPIASSWELPDYEPTIYQPIKVSDISLREEVAEAPREFFHNYTVLGRFFNTYWAVEQDNTLYLIDQHAAHERILYDELMDYYQKQKVLSQRLLRPMALNLSPKEAVVLEEHQNVLENLGFEIEAFGENTVAIRAVPVVFSHTLDPTFFLDVLNNLETGSSKDLDNRHEKIASMACKAAVKGGDKLTLTEATALINQLLKTQNPFTCPHGRPTIVKMSKYEIEKMFKRIQ